MWVGLENVNFLEKQYSDCQYHHKEDSPDVLELLNVTMKIQKCRSRRDRELKEGLLFWWSWGFLLLGVRETD